MLRSMTKCARKKYEPISISKSLRDNSPEAYSILREAMIKLEQKYTLGSRVQLTEKEQAANVVIMKEKNVEL